MQSRSSLGLDKFQSFHVELDGPFFALFHLVQEREDGGHMLFVQAAVRPLLEEEAGRSLPTCHCLVSVETSLRGGVETLLAPDDCSSRGDGASSSSS